MLLLRCLHARPLFTGTRILNNVLRGCSRSMSQTIAQNNQKTQDKFKSQRFPDYQLVYALPAISYVCLFNFAKTLSTVCLGLGTVTVGGLYATNFITPEVAIPTMATVGFGCMFFHLGGLMLSNNLVGSIYMKEEDDTAIISYVSYWGMRQNIYVDVAHIVPINEAPMNLMKIVYKKLHIASSKLRFRVYLGKGCIINDDKLPTVIGHWK